MPKLSKDTLKKRFSCPHCGESFRTRQGLSGHIQFKHQLLQNNNDTYFDKIRQLEKRLKLWQMAVKEKDLPKDISNLGEDILHRWLFLIGYFDQINIKLSDNDFKNFFIHNFSVTSSKSEQETQLALKALELLKPKL